MTVFYRFESADALFAAVGTAAEFSKDGIAYSVIGRIPDGGTEPLLNRHVWEANQTPPQDQKGQPDDVVLAAGGEQKPDGSTYRKGEPMTRPTFKAGWHVNASAEVEGWDILKVYPSEPLRIFG